MTLEDFKKTYAYFDADDITLCINGKDEVNADDYPYALDDCDVIGTGHFYDGNLLVDIICENWDEIKEIWRKQTMKNNKTNTKTINVCEKEMKNFEKHAKEFNKQMQRYKDEECFWKAFMVSFVFSYIFFIYKVIKNKK